MSKWRIWLGEWLHILADKVLPIPAFAKGGTHIANMGEFDLVESAAVVEGRDIYELAAERGLEIETAKEIAVMDAKQDIVRGILSQVGGRIRWAETIHGNSQRVYYEVKGVVVMKK